VFEKGQARQAGFNNEVSMMIPAGPDNKKAMQMHGLVI
jgi:hypothetical protein